MFTSLEAVLLKIGKGIESWFGTTFLKVWNSFPSGFNSEVSIKFEIKIHLSVCGLFFFFFLLLLCNFFEWLFSHLLTSDEPGGKSIREEQLLTRVRHSGEPGNNETDRDRQTEKSCILWLSPTEA